MACDAIVGRCCCRQVHVEGEFSVTPYNGADGSRGFILYRHGEPVAALHARAECPPQTRAAVEFNGILSGGSAHRSALSDGTVKSVVYFRDAVGNPADEESAVKSCATVRGHRATT